MPASRTPNETLIDINAVAARLGVQVRHVRRLVHERRIPYIKWGHLIRFDPADIDAWIDRARRPAATASAGDLGAGVPGGPYAAARRATVGGDRAPAQRGDRR